MKTKKSLTTFTTLSLLTVSAFLITACAQQISSDVYTTRQVGEVTMTHPGVIVSMREVRVQQGESLEDNGLGITGGGIAGGVIGNALGKGNFAPTAAGAVVGAVAGSLLEKKMKEQFGTEYVVRLDNGDIVTIVQGKDQAFQINQPVYIHVSPRGRSRISAQ